MKRWIMFLYSITGYVAALGALAYLAGFVGDLLVPRSVDRGPAASPGAALAIDLALLVLFGLQHSVMARSSFKRWLLRFVPPEAERVTYVMASVAVLIVLFWGWRPIPGVVWSVEAPAAAYVLWTVFAAGWLVAVAATFMIDHWELFGLRHGVAALRGASVPEPDFRTPLLYRLVRHPLQLGLLLAFWATPHMTAGHLLLAAGMTVYILVGLYYEERDLHARFGERYREYTRRVPMLLPWPRPAGAGGS